MSSIPVQIVIINAVVGNAILAAVFLYLWRSDRREGALGYWSAAYAASACRVGTRLFGLEGYSAAIYGEALFGTLVVVLLWMGTRAFIGKSLAEPWKTGLAAAVGMGAVAGLAAHGTIPLIVPYLIAGGIYFLLGRALLRRGRERPGVGYGVVGFLFALFGGYVVVFSQMTTMIGDSRAYLFGPIINLLIGMVLLVVAQRKLQFEAEKIAAALQREAAGRLAAEDSVVESEQRYRAIVDSARSMIGLLSPEGVLLDVNRAALERTGIRREEVVGRPFWETPWWSHDAAQQQRLRQAVRRVAAGGHDRFEASHPAADGSLDYFDFFLTPIRDAAGQVIYLVPEAHDITARRLAEQTLHAAEQRFRAICEGSMLGVFVTDAAAQVTYFSRRAIEITGIAETEALSGRAAERIHRDDLEQHRLAWRNALAERKPFVSERRHVRREGGLAWCRMHVAPILEGDMLLGFVGTLEDINARKQSEQALRESEERLSRVFHLLPDLVTVSSIDEGRFVDMNHQWEGMLGYTREEALGKTAAELGIWRDAAQRNKLVEDVRRRGAVRRREIAIHRKDGTELLCETSGSTFEWHGQSLLLLVTRDVTAQRALERARGVAETALRESEEKFSRFFDLGPEPMAVVRYDDAVYLDVNQAWLGKFGYRREEVIGRTPLELNIWEDFEERRRVIEALDRDGMVKDREVWFRSKDARRILADVSAQMFELAGARYVLWDVHDITEKRLAERQRHVSELKFSKAFHSSPDYMTLCRLADGMLIDCNEAFERFTGYSRGEAIGRTVVDLGLWARQEERRLFAEILAGQGWTRDFECTLRGRDGREMSTVVSASTMEIEDAQCVITAARDVGAQRRMERELRASEEMFSTIFLQLPVAVAVTTAQEGRFVDVNDAWSHLFGFRKEEVVGKTSIELNLWVDPSDRARLVEEIRAIPVYYNREFMLRGKDGRELVIEGSGRVFEIGGEQVLLWAATDVTERKRVERALRESEEKFSAIFHRSPVALGVTTVPEGCYLDVNATWERQFRYPRDGMIGKTSLEIGLWLDVGERRRLFDDIGQQPHVQNREVRFRRGDGVEILCELSAQVFELGGQRFLLWGAHDVTEHRRTQQEIGELNMKLEARVLERTSRLEKTNAELSQALDSLKLAQSELVRAEKLAALGSLVAGVAHELNTPIGNSVTVASTLREKAQTFGLAAAAGRLKRSVLDRFLDDTLTAGDLLLRSLSQANELVGSFKQVAVDQASAQRRRFDLKLVIEEVVATIVPMLKKTPFKLELELADNLAMDSFPGPVGQVITNLITNALAHAFEGRDRGTMRLSAQRNGLHMIKMIFIDDGIGIPAADLKRVFDPFFTTKLGRGGSGLGLHIVYSLVTRVLGGRIQVASAPASGTRFEMLIPMMAPETAERAP